MFKCFFPHRLHLFVSNFKLHAKGILNTSDWRLNSVITPGLLYRSSHHPQICDLHLPNLTSAKIHFQSCGVIVLFCRVLTSYSPDGVKREISVFYFEVQIGGKNIKGAPLKTILSGFSFLGFGANEIVPQITPVNLLN